MSERGGKVTSALLPVAKRWGGGPRSGGGAVEPAQPAGEGPSVSPLRSEPPPHRFAIGRRRKETLRTSAGGG